MPGSPLAVTGGASYLEMDAEGKFLFAPNSGSDTVSVFSIDTTTGALTQLSGSPYATGTSPLAAALAGSNSQYLYVANYVSNTISRFSVGSDGSLSSLGAAFFTGITNYAITPSPDGGYLYATGASNSVIQMKITDATGQLSSLGTVSSTSCSNGTLLSTIFDPSGKYFFAACYQPGGPAATGQLIDGFTFDSSTGALTAINPTLWDVATGPNSNQDLVFDPSGQYMYLASFAATSNSGLITGMSVNLATGALSSVTGSPVANASGKTTLITTANVPQN